MEEMSLIPQWTSMLATELLSSTDLHVGGDKTFTPNGRAWYLGFFEKKFAVCNKHVKATSDLPSF